MAFTDRLHNRGSISTGYDIDNSLKFEPDNSEYIYRTPSSAGNRKTWTLSFWIKRTELADGSNTMRVFEAWTGSTGTSALFTATDNFILDLSNGSNYFTSNARFRDTAAWYHFVIRVDTTQGTASERARVYVNGSELAGSWNSNIGQNTDLTWNLDVAHNFARFHNGDSYVSAYYAEIINVDGTSLAPTAFGEFDEDSGIWKPKAANPTYGTNGFKLEFKSSGSLGADTSGNGHTWSLNAIAAADQSTDTPTNNFCTYNNNFKTATGIAATEGQTKVTCASGAGWLSIVATFGLTSGKWYWEAASSGNYVFYGIADVESDKIPQATGGYFLGYGDDNSTKAIGMYGINGQVYSDTAGHNGPGAAANTVVQIALDMDNRCVYFGANGSYISGADPTSGASKTNASQWNANWTDTVYPALSVAQGYHSTTNFGGYTTDVISSPQSDANGYGTFEYAPPSGYYAICTKNLAEYG